LLQGDDENAAEAFDGQTFDAVLCHGVLGYIEDPEPLVTQLCQCINEGGTVSIISATAGRVPFGRPWSSAGLTRQRRSTRLTRSAY
jgi:SAM-dependent methyltransferase